jgi:predicted  nucleic acid-binding Zn-ribbon protein
MHPDIEQLIKLQEVDEQLLELERSKEYLPEIIENVKREVHEAQAQVETTRTHLEEARLKHRQLEVDLQEAQENLGKYEKQMASIKTNKEYDALTTEIESTKERIGFIEDEIILTLNEIDEMTTSLAEAQKRHELLAASNKDQLENLEREMGAVEDKVNVKLELRKNISVRVTKGTLSVYERVRRGRGSPVVVPLKKHACGACFKAQPPQRIQELRKGLTVITCDNCGRFLMLQNGEPDSDV